MPQVAVKVAERSHNDRVRREIAAVLSVINKCSFVCCYQHLAMKDGKLCIIMKLYKESLDARINAGGQYNGCDSPRVLKTKYLGTELFKPVLNAALWKLIITNNLNNSRAVARVFQY
jgi:hypothetical protein